MKLYNTFLKRTSELSQLQSILQTLTWDQETMMPKRGGILRAGQIATLSTLYHKKLTDPQLGQLLDELEGQKLDLWQQASLREMRREYRKAVQLPEELVRELAETTSLAYETWVGAREKSDFSAFAPWLDKVVDLKRQQARCLSSNGSLYGTLLDDYEPGISVEKLDDLFAFLRPKLTSLLHSIQSSKHHPPRDLLKGHFPVDKQQIFARDVLTSMGFDWTAGRLDRSPHPFCTGLTPLDVRITTRYSEEDFSTSFFGVVHEGGHALYEQGLDADKYGWPACDAISLGVHESQSRLWENQVARSSEFWESWFPRLKTIFPGELDEISFDEFLHGINRVEASLIRVEADEISYGLHVILRYELEKSLIEENLQVDDLEPVWNERMKDYLGIVPSRASDGVLQDTHWSQGLIGYFPTYLLGNLYAAQIFREIQESIPDLADQIRTVNLLPLREWLRQNIHVRGKTATAEELMKEITGRPLQPDPFLSYLKTKFTEIYSL